METQELHRGRLIDHIQLVVRDLPASQRFYQAIFDVLKIPMFGPMNFSYPPPPAKRSRFDPWSTPTPQRPHGREGQRYGTSRVLVDEPKRCGFPQFVHRNDARAQTLIYESSSAISGSCLGERG